MSWTTVGLRSDAKAVEAPARAYLAARRHLSAVLPIAFTVVVGYLVVAPLVQVQLRAMDDGASAYRRALDLPSAATTLRTTLALGVGATCIALVLGTGLAWAAARLPRRLAWLGIFPILPIVVPPVASVTGWAFLLNPKIGYINQALRAVPFIGGSSGPVDIFTPTWIVIVTGLSLTSFVYVFVRSGLRRLNYELVEAAQVSGASSTRAFFGVILPMIRPSLVYGGSIAFLLGLGQFTAPLLLGTRRGVTVISTEVYRYVSTSPDYGMAAAIASPLLLVGIVVVVFQRVMLGNQERFATDTGKVGRLAARSSKVAVVPVAAFGVAGVLLPVVGLAIVALSPFWNGKIDVSAMTLDHFRQLFDSSAAWDAIRTSVVLALAGVLCALPVGYLVAEILYRRRANALVRSALDLIVNLPLGIPAVVFGAGFLFTYTHRPLVLYGTKWVIVLVYITLMLPFTTRLQLASRIALGDSYEQASRVAGAGGVRTHLSIVLPLTRGALSGAAALMFVLLTHEFTASLFVRSSHTQVMGTLLYDTWTTSSYSQVAAMALVMCFITTVGVGLAVWLGGGLTTLDRL